VDSLELDRVKGDIEQILPSLGKHRIEELRQVIDRHYAKRFKGKRRTPKYGNLNKGFTDNQLNVFFKAIDNEKYRLLFSYQANLGLRVGEVVKLNIKDINQQTRELTVFTEKAKTVDTLIIPLKLFEETQTYINCFSLEIRQAKGYIFFRDPSKSNREEPYLEPNYVRKVFRHYVQEARLNEDAYALSDEDRGRTQRQLHRLTTHSLRHYAITKFAKQVNGNLVLTSRFARHSEPSITMTYIAKDKEQLYAEIDRAFGVARV
jgi:integrase